MYEKISEITDPHALESKPATARRLLNQVSDATSRSNIVKFIGEIEYRLDELNAGKPDKSEPR
jgi:hypothetical protein